MARIAGTLSAFERCVHKGLHQFRAVRLVRIVTLHAICSRKGLVSMRLLKSSVFGIVTIQAKLRCRFGQVISELVFAGISILVDGVAGGATQIQGSVPASFFRNIQAHCVTAQAKILSFLTRDWLQELLFVSGLMRVVAVSAIADAGWMYSTLALRGVLFRVAGYTQLATGCRNQLHASDIFRGPNFVATHAADGHRAVDMRTLGLFCMALQALGCVGLRLERDGMYTRTQARPTGQERCPRNRTDQSFHSRPRSKPSA